MAERPEIGFEPTVREGVLCVRRPDTRWLSTGWNGGRSRGPAAYNVSVPEGFERTDLAAYRDERLGRAAFATEGSAESPVSAEPPGSADYATLPTLFTGVSLCHARGARHGSVVAYATAGLSNPAMLPMEPVADDAGSGAVGDRRQEALSDHPGTVNLIIGTTRHLEAGAAANLVAVAAEAKATTLLATAGVPGTTSDAIVVGDDPTGTPAAFSGSATAVGESTRICVRDAIRASLQSRYPDGEFPGPAAEAEHGLVADDVAEVFNP